MATDDQPTKKKLPKWVMPLLIVIGIVVLLKVLPVNEWLEAVFEFIDGFGKWQYVAFVVAYVIITVVLLPASVFTIGAGAKYGILWGTIWVSIGSTIAATVAFLIGRYLAKNWVRKKIDANPGFSAVDRAISEDGWLITFLIRLSPAFPFTFLNYALSVTRLKTWHYITASWLGMLPGTVMYVYIGYITKAAADDASAGGADSGKWVIRIVGLLATIAVTVLVTKKAKKALRDADPGLTDPEKESDPAN